MAVNVKLKPTTSRPKPSVQKNKVSHIIVGTCKDCKGWGAQGIIMYHKDTGESYRTCIIDMFGDLEIDTIPMFELKITFGRGKGEIKTYKDFGCPNFNSTWETNV